MNACAKVSANWFPKEERLRATAVSANAFILGISAGLFLPSLFVDEKTPQDQQKQDVFKLGLVTAIISSVITLPILFTFRSRPEGVQEENEVGETKHSQWQEIKLMVKNASFILTTLASSCLMGYFATLTTVLE